MRKSRLQENSTEGEVDMTPMLDIVFILLIFFIVTTSFIKEEGLVINRPKAQNNPPSANSPTIVIQISDEGLIRFNGKLVDIERVPARIETFLSKNVTNSAIILPDFNSTHEMVVEVIDQVKPFQQLVISIGK